MPEYPDIETYIDCLRPRVVGAPLRAVRLATPFLLRTAQPPLSAIEGRAVREVRRLGKRIVWCFDDDLYLVLHLMIAGRIRWKPAGAKLSGKAALAAFDFDGGTLVLTEASSHRRASLHVVQGTADLGLHDRGGLELMDASGAEFARVVRSENHTLKRTLTDPRLLSGIGNAYSDEILHAAQLSPVKLSQQLNDAEIEHLYDACRETLDTWQRKLRAAVGDGFPDKVTAFHPDMAVHGKYGQPCPRCGDPVQRIVYAKNETNYCATCQTGGKLLADRSLSRLLKGDWPRTLTELDERLGRH